MVQLPSAPSERRKLHHLQDHASFTGHGVGGGVELADFVQPPERNDDLAMVRRLAADEAGIAALRHESDLVRIGKLADLANFGGRARSQHQRRAAMEQIAFFGDIGRDVARIGQRMLVANDLAELCDQLGCERRRLRLSNVHCCVAVIADPRLRGAACR